MRYVIANHKMKMNLVEVKNWIKDFDNLIGSTNIDINKISIIIAPSYIHIPYYLELSKKYNFINIASQDVNIKNEGSYTGKVSVNQVKDFCGYSIVGHTETKNETNEKVEKTNLCLKNDLNVILCSANPIQEFEEVIKNSIINISKKENLLLAYEDPKNISKNGVYNQKPIEEIKDSVFKIKQKYNNNYIIYGGSINTQNIEQISNISELSGVLIGSASLEPKSFIEIIKNFSK